MAKHRLVSIVWVWREKLQWSRKFTNTRVAQEEYVIDINQYVPVALSPRYYRYNENEDRNRDCASGALNEETES